MSANTDPKAPEQVSSDAAREISTIEFPYADLDNVVALVKAVFNLGGSCELAQLAAQLGHESATSGGFRLKIAAARTFQVVELERGKVSINALGTRLIDEDDSRAAKVDAFLSVALYKAVYEKYKNSPLPPSAGLEKAMVDLGVSSKQKDKARQVFQRSAKQAGFFDFGTSRLIMPANIKVTAKQPEKRIENTQDDGRRKASTEREREHHPFIEGLLEKLPVADTEWKRDARAKWLQTAANIFELMYSDSDPDGTINIELKKTSAK
jgi:hypothetical protein